MVLLDMGLHVFLDVDLGGHNIMKVHHVISIVSGSSEHHWFPKHAMVRY
jgi:hypothetical protein